MGCCMCSVGLEEMRGLLRAVPDSYDDFVSGMLDFHWDDPVQRAALYHFVTEHPDAHTDDVMEYMEQFLDLYVFESIIA